MAEEVKKHVVSPVKSPSKVVKTKEKKPKKKPYDRPNSKNYTAEFQVYFENEEDESNEECIFTVWFPDVKTFHKVESGWFHDLDSAVEKWFVETKKTGDDKWRMDSAIEIFDEETGVTPDLYFVDCNNISRTAPKEVT
jgi:hypothetical protein